MFKKVFIFFTLFVTVFSTFKCSNFRQSQLNLLEKTNWIPVLRDTGKCYFHNILTKDDTDEFPIKKINL